MCRLCIHHGKAVHSEGPSGQDMDCTTGARGPSRADYACTHDALMVNLYILDVHLYKAWAGCSPANPLTARLKKFKIGPPMPHLEQRLDHLEPKFSTNVSSCRLMVASWSVQAEDAKDLHAFLKVGSFFELL